MRDLREAIERQQRSDRGDMGVVHVLYRITCHHRDTAAHTILPGHLGCGFTFTQFEIYMKNHILVDVEADDEVHTKFRAEYHAGLCDVLKTLPQIHRDWLDAAIQYLMIQ